MSGGPPPVPGGRTPEEREAARRERDARRAQAAGAGPAVEEREAPPVQEPQVSTPPPPAAPPGPPEPATQRSDSGRRTGRLAVALILAAPRRWAQRGSRCPCSSRSRATARGRCGWWCRRARAWGRSPTCWRTGE